MVDAAGRLDNALEVGLNAGLSFPGVLNPFDSLTVSANIRWDVLGAHEGRVIEPGVTYATRSGAECWCNSAPPHEIIDDNFVRLLIFLASARRLMRGQRGAGPVSLPTGSALNRIGHCGMAIMTVDLDLERQYTALLNGGPSILCYGAAGYARV